MCCRFHALLCYQVTIALSASYKNNALQVSNEIVFVEIELK